MDDAELIRATCSCWELNVGYFRRPIDRSRAAKQKRRHARRPLRKEVAAVLREIGDVPPDPAEGCLIRLVVEEQSRRSNRPLGIFSAASYLAEDEPLTLDEQRQLRDTIRWFNEHLIAPRRLDLPASAIFWFKLTASECLARAWTYIHILQAHDILVFYVATDQPGRIVYEDDQQVAAIPFRDRPPDDDPEPIEPDA